MSGIKPNITIIVASNVKLNDIAESLTVLISKVKINSLSTMTVTLNTSNWQVLPT